MKTQLLEFISLIGAGCMREADIERVADEAAQAYADPAAGDGASSNTIKLSDRSARQTVAGFAAW